MGSPEHYKAVTNGKEDPQKHPHSSENRNKAKRFHPGSTIRGESKATSNTTTFTGPLAFSRRCMSLSTDPGIDDMDNCSSTQRQSFI